MSNKQKHVLIDGDLLVYRSCATKAVSTADQCCDYFDKVVDYVLWELQDFPDDSSYCVFLTGKGNFRKDIYPEYKANRSTGKPWYPRWCRDYEEYRKILGVVRDHCTKAWNTVVCDGYEADDGISLAAHRLGFKNVIVASSDKDFCQLPCEIYNTYHWKREIISKQDARRNLWAQVISGDSIDNIKGCRGYGKPKALKALTGCKTENDYKQVTLQVYQTVFGEDAEEQMNLNYRLVKLLGSMKEYETAVSQG